MNGDAPLPSLPAQTHLPVRHLSLFLFRPEVSQPHEAFFFEAEAERDLLRTGRYSNSAESRFAWLLKTGHLNPTAWAEDLAEIVGQPNVNARSASSSAAIAFRVPDPAGNWRVFGSAWGHAGRHMLDLDKIEDRFGILTALNIIDPEKVRSKDSRSFDDTIKQTRTQASRRTAFNEFGFDPMREILDEVTAQTLPAHADFADRVTGSHYLQLTATMQPKDLFAKATDALRLYQLEDYKTRFPWVKSKQSVTNPVELERLDEELVSLIRTGAHSNIHLAPLDVVDWNDIEGFRHKGERDPIIHADLEWVDYVARIDPSAITREQIHKDSLRVKYLGSDREDKWSIYKCIVAELDVADKKYILSAGRWFRLERTWVEQIEEGLASIPEAANLPDAGHYDQRESDYNEAAAFHLGAVCMDRVPVRPFEAASDIELCDILTEDLQFVHVKKRESSATLSHLFLQGSVSAATLISDRHFRSQAAEKIRAKSPDFGPLQGWENLQATDLEVIYGVMCEERFRGKNKLPFFAKVGLWQAFQVLQRMKVETSFATALRPET